MTEARDHLALVLDAPAAEDARALASRLRPWFGIVKVGYELYAAAGPEVLEQLRDQGFRVFADLKLHDIPTTVGRGAEALGRRGVDFLNFHASGGVPMLRAGVEGLARGAKEAGYATPVALAVTVLTSDNDTSAFAPRLDAAIESGCDGVVCSALEVAQVKERVRSFGTMVPGIRMAGDSNDDQARVATPDAAIRAGADWLVIGRSVTAAADPEAAAEAVTSAVEDALASRRDTR